MRTLRALAVAACLSGLTALTACSSGGSTTAATTQTTVVSSSTSAAARAPRYVAVGASETVGVGADDPATQAWPRVLAATPGVLAAGTPVDVLGVSGSTTAEALDVQVPKAEVLQPTIVSVWLNVNDLLRLVPATIYEDQLDQLVHRLRQGGAAVVAVANVPPIDRLPVVTACQPGAAPNGHTCPIPEAYRNLVFGPNGLSAFVTAYNEAIARVVAKEGAILVDLQAAGLAARAAGTEASLVGKDGFHPSTAGHAAVAAAFAAAIKAAR